MLRPKIHARDKAESKEGERDGTLQIAKERLDLSVGRSIERHDQDSRLVLGLFWPLQLLVGCVVLVLRATDVSLPQRAGVRCLRRHEGLSHEESRRHENESHLLTGGVSALTGSTD